VELTGIGPDAEDRSDRTRKSVSRPVEATNCSERNQQTHEEVFKRMRAAKEECEKSQKETEPMEKEKDIFSIEEIKIEEMAIDGICGVY